MHITKKEKSSPFCLPFGKADDTASSALSGVANSSLWLHPWAPWICDILNFLL